MKHQLYETKAYRSVPAVSGEVFDQLWLINHGHTQTRVDAECGHLDGAWRVANHDRPIVQALAGYLRLLEQLDLCAQEREGFVLRYLAASLLISISEHRDIIADFVLRKGGRRHGPLLAVHCSFLRFAAEAELVQANTGRTFFPRLGDVYSHCQVSRDLDVFCDRDGRSRWQCPD